MDLLFIDNGEKIVTSSLNLSESFDFFRPLSLLLNKSLSLLNPGTVLSNKIQVIWKDFESFRVLHEKRIVASYINGCWNVSE